MDTPKLLIADDEPIIRKNLHKFLLRNIECVIQEAPDGRKALEILNKQPFDLILLDIKMPGVSGIDVVKQLRASSPNTDILVISAWDSQAIAAEVLTNGAIDYITKPSTIEVVYSKICEILQKRNKFFPKK